MAPVTYGRGFGSRVVGGKEDTARKLTVPAVAYAQHAFSQSPRPSPTYGRGHHVTSAANMVSSDRSIDTIEDHPVVEAARRSPQSIRPSRNGPVILHDGMMAWYDMAWHDNDDDDYDDQFSSSRRRKQLFWPRQRPSFRMMSVICYPCMNAVFGVGAK